MAGQAAETIVGALVLAVAGGFIAYAAQSTDLRGGESGYPLVATFFKADGMSVGGDVRIAGVKVGSVRSLTLDPKTYQAALELSIRDGVKVPSDSSVKIASDGLLGGSYVAIEPGGSEYMLEPGEAFEYTQGSVSILDLVGKAMYSATK